jgi:hypothetical protein
VSVRLDGEVLSEEHYRHAVGGRRLEMVFKKGSVVHVAVACDGVTLSELEMLKARIDKVADGQREIENDIRMLQRDIENRIRMLQDDFRRREIQSRANVVYNILMDFVRLFEGRFRDATLTEDLDNTFPDRSYNPYFFHTGPISLETFSALRSYTNQYVKHDSLPVLSAKVWMFRELLTRGLPEVRVPMPQFSFHSLTTTPLPRHCTLLTRHTFHPSRRMCGTTTRASTSWMPSRA